MPHTEPAEFTKQLPRLTKQKKKACSEAKVKQSNSVQSFLTDPSSRALRRVGMSLTGHHTSAIRHLLVTSKLHRFRI